MRKLLLTGGSGLLALNWARVATSQWEVHAAFHERIIASPHAVGHHVDLGSDDFGALLDAFSPDLVVHTAGLTSVEACEADPAAAERANVRLPARVAARCAERRIKLVHISTDHLFVAAPMATEDTVPEPVNEYARTKIGGEEAVLSAASDALVARTNFYGWGPSYRRSFSDRILDDLRAGAAPTLFEDVFFTPILMDVLVRAVEDLVGKGAEGIYNIVADERLSKYEFGRRLAAQFGLDPTPIRAGRLADATALAARPREMSLSNAKAVAALGRPLGTVNSHLAQLASLETDPKVKEVQTL
jgi:dTDP-4-dehydrorhamnose reductase